MLPTNRTARRESLVRHQSNLVEVMSQTSKAPYKGMMAGGAIWLMEVILSDFARVEAESTGSRDEAQERQE